MSTRVIIHAGASEQLRIELRQSTGEVVSVRRLRRLIASKSRSCDRRLSRGEAPRRNQFDLDAQAGSARRSW
jgi:hypothetical protein